MSEGEYPEMADGAEADMPDINTSVTADAPPDATVDHEDSCPDPSMSNAATASFQEAPSMELDTSLYMKVCLPSFIY